MSARPQMSGRLRLLGSTAAVAGVLLTAACGGGGSATASGASSASPSASDRGAGRAAFNQCLEKNGVTPPSRGPGGGGGFASMSPEMQKAFQACRSLLPRGNGRFGQNPAALAAFRTCMTSHGVVLPTRPSGTPGQGDGQSQNPSPGPGGRVGGFLRGLNTADPKVAAALKICSALLPTRPASPAPAAT